MNFPIYAPVRGAYYRGQHAIDALARIVTAPDTARWDLVPEPSNPHDPNAVQVHLHGEHVGYIGREWAGQISEALRSGTRLSARLDHWLNEQTPVLEIAEPEAEEVPVEEVVTDVGA